jgi:hypothetical protein
MKRVLLQDNLFDDITGSTWGGQGRLFQILGWAAGSTYLVIEHNTGVQTENLNYSDGLAHLGFIYRNNFTPRGGAGLGFIGVGAAEGLPTLTVYFPLAVFLPNVIAGGNALIYPPENFFPASLAAVGFVDLAGRNYRLAATSPYKNAATDGTDIGADIDALETATAGVLSGTPATSDTSRPTISLRNGMISFWDGSVERLFGSAISRRGWHHVAIVSDGSTLRVYLDGAPSGTPQVVSLGAVMGTLQAGSWTMGSANYDFVGGRIDEVRVYTRTLAQTEVDADMNTPIAP